MRASRTRLLPLGLIGGILATAGFGLAAPDVVAPPEAVDYTLNSAGFRDDREYSVPKPPGVRRLVFVGDGFTYGARLPLEESFVEQTESRLREWTAVPYQWEVLNVSGPALNLMADIDLLTLKGLRYAPDVVVLMYHLNDAQGNQDTPLGGGPTTFTRLVDFIEGDVSRNEAAEVQRFLRDRGYLPALGPILRPLSRRDLSYLLAHYLPLYWDAVVEALDRLEHLSTRHGFEVVVGVIPEIDRSWDIYPFDDLHARVGAELSAHGFRVVDMKPALVEYPNEELMVGGTDGHTNALANEIIAEELEAALVEID